MKKTALLLLVAISLSACISGKAPHDSYTSPATGKTTVIESDREMCESSCNEDYSRCMETQPAEAGVPGTPTGMFGAAAQCRTDLSKCLPGCKSR